MRFDVIETNKRPAEIDPSDVLHVTARTPVGICRECGRDITGGHESMKCLYCRSHSEEWNDADLY